MSGDGDWLILERGGVAFLSSVESLWVFPPSQTKLILIWTNFLIPTYLSYSLKARTRLESSSNSSTTPPLHISHSGNNWLFIQQSRPSREYTIVLQTSSRKGSCTLQVLRNHGEDLNSLQIHLLNIIQYYPPLPHHDHSILLHENIPVQDKKSQTNKDRK